MLVLLRHADMRDALPYLRAYADVATRIYASADDMFII